jgi:hypothetical protein
MLRGTSRGSGKSMTFSESTSRKSSDFEYEVVGFGCGPWRCYRGAGEIHMNKGRVGEERGGKEMDGCPLTSVASLRPWPTWLTRWLMTAFSTTCRVCMAGYSLAVGGGMVPYPEQVLHHWQGIVVPPLPQTLLVYS